MTLSTIFMLSVALSADAFTVSVTNGMTNSKITLAQRVATALTFAVFQGLMPIIGFFVGLEFSELISGFDNYIAFFLLSFIGVKMLIESRKCEEKDECPTFSPKILFLQGVATSIDALVVGVSLCVINVNIFIASLIICVITFAICFFGVTMGKKIGLLFGKKAEMLGGVILILIGLKILLEGIL